MPWVAQRDLFTRIDCEREAIEVYARWDFISSRVDIEFCLGIRSQPKVVLVCFRCLEESLCYNNGVITVLRIQIHLSIEDHTLLIRWPLLSHSTTTSSFISSHMQSVASWEEVTRGDRGRIRYTSCSLDIVGIFGAQIYNFTIRARTVFSSAINSKF